MKAHILVIAALMLGASCVRTTLSWTAREKTVIFKSSPVMYVTTLPQDSTILRAKCLEVGEKDYDSKELKTLLEKMLKTVTDPSQEGVGIAAPQVGVNRRIVLVQRLDKEDEPFEAYVNIQIDSLWGDIVVLEEGCLSVPAQRGPVPRYSNVKISYIRDGKKVSECVEGYTARIFQHECDHLDGILYIDRALEVFTDTTWAAQRENFTYERPEWF